MAKNSSLSQKSVLVIDAMVPKPDRDAGSLRMYNLLRLLTSLSLKVTFAVGNLEPSEPYTDNLKKLGVKVLAKPTIDSINTYLQQEGAIYDVVILSRVSVAARYMACVREHAPQAMVIFDTVDLHYVREYRGAKVKGNIPLLKRALQTKSQELAAAQMADCTLVVSPTEKVTLEKECPGINVKIISVIHETYPSTTSFSQRKNILFIGSFHHHPNTDAVRYFVNDVFPALREKIAGLKVYIIGDSPPESIKNLSSQNIVVTGYEPDVAPYFHRCKLSIAPLRYGAGVKGKVHLSMSYGVPVVVSSIAAEGMDIVHGQHAMIADTPDQFCQAVTKVYYNQNLWSRLSKNGHELITSHFSFEAARLNLIDVLTEKG
jgi:glycosyltransferase involved in cell wall biosynthesis